MYQYQIKSVEQVLSGDTLAVTLDLGFRLTYQVELTLTNAKTERFGTLGQQGRIFTQEWLDDKNGPFTVQVNKDRKDNYEGQLFNAAGDDLGDDLITASLGRAIGS